MGGRQTGTAAKLAAEMAVAAQATAVAGPRGAAAMAAVRDAFHVTGIMAATFSICGCLRELKSTFALLIREHTQHDNKQKKKKKKKKKGSQTLFRFTRPPTPTRPAFAGAATDAAPDTRKGVKGVAGGE